MIKRIRVANLGWLGLSLLVVAIDQLSKQWVLANLTPIEAIRVFPFFDILLSYNTGAAFGFLNNASGWQQWLFGGVAIVVSAVIIVSLLIQTRWHWFMSLGLALILGGALGNLYDRMTRGFVVDFLHLHLHGWSWPIFNLADTAICIGAGLLLIDIFLQREGR